MECTRFEIFDNGNVCHGGFLYQLHHLNLPSITRHTVYEFWTKRLPRTPHIEGEYKTYFTPAGLQRFKKNIESLKKLYANYSFVWSCFACIMDVRETVINTEDVPAKRIVYQDAYQVLIAN